MKVVDAVCACATPNDKVLLPDRMIVEHVSRSYIWLPSLTGVVNAFLLTQDELSKSYLFGSFASFAKVWAATPDANFFAAAATCAGAGAGAGHGRMGAPHRCGQLPCAIFR